MDDEGLDPDALEAELGRGGDVSFLYTIPTFQNPSGRTLSEERRAADRRARRRARPRRARGRPVRARALRGRGAAVAPRARGRRARDVHVVVLEDRRARAARRLVRRPGGAPGGLRRARRVDVHLAAAPPAGDRCTSSIARGGFEPNLERIRGSSARSATRCSPRSSDELEGRATWSHPEGGYFLWVDFARRRRGRAARRGRRRRASRSSAGPTSSPTGRVASSSARLAFCYETPERIAEGVRVLARLVP